MAKRDYYEVLGVDRGADERTLKKAYRQRAMELHPDRNPDDPQAEEAFKEAAEAYQVLSDAQKREVYDRYGHAGLQGGGGAPGFQDMGDVFSHFQDIFGDFFGGGGGFGFGQRRARPDAPQRGADVRTVVDLSLQDVVFGAEREIELSHPAPCSVCGGSGAKDNVFDDCRTCGGTGQIGTRRGAFVLQSTCPTCHGQGRIPREACPACDGTGEEPVERRVKLSVPAGIAEGQTLRLAGQGQAGKNGGPAGHLYVSVRVAPHEQFERDGFDLVHLLRISFPQATLGTVREVESLDPEEPPIEVDVPAGVQPNDTLVVRGAGIPRLDGRGRGDLVCVVQVNVPRELSPRARELIEELATTLNA
ncbi:MAG: molecular chaperone DnaJ [Myxococcota bacterium]